MRVKNHKLCYGVMAASLILGSVPALAANGTTDDTTTNQKLVDRSAAPNNPASLRNDIPGQAAGTTAHGSDNSFPGQHVVGAPTTGNDQK